MFKLSQLNKISAMLQEIDHLIAYFVSLKSLTKTLERYYSQ